MHYMVFIKMADDVGNPPTALMEAMGQEMQQGFADGTLVHTGGLYADSFRTEFRVRAGEVTSTDGPFTEAKEAVGGFAIIDVRDHAEAVENARRMAELHRLHWPEWSGAVEARRIAIPGDGPPPSS